MFAGCGGQDYNTEPRNTSNYPWYWFYQAESGVWQRTEAFTVDRQTSEFKEVERYVQEIGLLREQLKYIYRIQNVDLWELYCRKKSQLLRVKGQSDFEERMLFHGTGKNNVDSICLYNFDCRIPESVKYGHVYGKGTYFSVHAYADSDPSSLNNVGST